MREQPNYPELFHIQKKRTKFGPLNLISEQGIIQHNRLDKGAKNLQSVSENSQNDSVSLFSFQ